MPRAPAPVTLPLAPSILQLGTSEGAESLLLQSIATLGGATPAKQAKGAPASASSPAVACLEALVALRLKAGRVSDAVAAFEQLRAAQGAGSPMPSTTAAVSGNVH